MSNKEFVINVYFEWLYDLVCHDRYDDTITYKKLLYTLHDIPFRYSMMMDENRADDGVALRYRFAYENCDHTLESYLTGPCSVLEMLIALSIRCEETIMDNPEVGDRIKQWFWHMVTNLGLGFMDDDRFDEDYVEEVIDRFLNREYSSNGKGGLFTIRDCDENLRNVEIWTQLMWYLNTIE